MFKRIDCYLWREVWPAFGVALLAFLVFIGLELVLSLSDVLFAHGAGASAILRLLVFKLPSVFTLAIPAGVLLAVFLALSRLASDRELLAFQALGYSLRRILVPFVLFGLLASGGSFLLSELAVPAAEAAYRQELLSILYRGEIPNPREDVFFRGGEGELYYVSRHQGERAYGIVVYDLGGELYPHQGPYPVVITAREGRFSGEELELSDGRVLRFSPDGGLEEVVRFNSLTLRVGEELQQGLLAGKTPSEMSVRELLARVRLFQRSGLDPRNLLVELHSKLAVAAAALVFALFGAPVGVLLGRRGRAAGAVAGFLLAAAAQGLFIWTRTLARRGFLPPSLGAWLPHILLGGLGIVLLLSVDRLRVRGLRAAFLGVLLLATSAMGAPPPFLELWAEELVVQSNAEVIQAQGAQAKLRGWDLAAEGLTAAWHGDSWELSVQGAELTGEGISLRSDQLSAEVGADGAILWVTAQRFSGSSRFRGPEKEETLLFQGKWGKAHFRGGELVQVEGQRVEFSTCPCLAGAPYSVAAERFLLLPERWLYAEGVVVWAFGRPVGWLPVYAARLGKEASPLFPELGRLAGDWFLRWHIPFALEEGTWGALGLTWFPFSSRLDPSLKLVWETGSLDIARDRIQLDWTGKGWRAALSGRPGRVSAALTGTLRETSWSIAWGEAKRGELVYKRAPELSLSRGGVDWLGGDLSLTVTGGRYVEEAPGWRTEISLGWNRSWELDSMRFSLPVKLALAQYPGQERVVLEVYPQLSLSGVSLSYLGRLRVGRSPFEFDRAPPESRLSLNLAVEEGEVLESLSLGWDLAQGKVLPGRWSLSLPGLKLTGEFSLAPLAVEHLRWQASYAGERSRVEVQGGIRLYPLVGEDLIAKGRAWGEGWKLTGGVRLGTFPLTLKRVAASAELSLGEDWGLRAAGEYDALGGRFLQLSLAVLRSFSGCLRAGLELYLGGIRLSLEVPAFPQARASFAPLDEGLRLGG